MKNYNFSFPCKLIDSLQILGLSFLLLGSSVLFTKSPAFGQMLHEWGHNLPTLVHHQALRSPSNLCIDSEGVIFHYYTNDSAFLVKMDHNGTLIWKTPTPYSHVSKVAVNSQGKIMVNLCCLEEDIMVYNPDGSLDWSFYSGINELIHVYARGNSIIDDLGNVYYRTATLFNIPVEEHHLLLMKIGPGGVLEWMDTLEHVNIMEGSMLFAPNGDFISLFSARIWPSPVNYRTFVTRITPSGTKVWHNSLLGNMYDFILDDYGNIYATGSDTVGASIVIEVKKIDFATGNEMWSYKHNQISHGSFSGHIQLKENRLYVSGSTFNSNFIVPTILKLDLNGNRIWTYNLNLPGISSARAFHSHFLPNGTIVGVALTHNQLGIQSDDLILVNIDTNKVQKQILFHPEKITHLDMAKRTQSLVFGDILYITGRKNVDWSFISKYCLEGCVPNVTGQVYNDKNNNCQKNSGEANIPLSLLRINNGQYHAMSNFDGTFHLLQPIDTHNIEPVAPPYWEFNCPGTPVVYVAPRNNINLALHATNVVKDFTVTTSTPIVRPNGEFFYVARCTNNGTDTASGYLSMRIDTNYQIQNTFLPMPDTLAGTYLSWRIDSVAPRNFVEFAVKLWVDSNFQLIGQRPFIETIAHPLPGDTTPDDNVVVDSLAILGAFDPNCKISNPQEQDGLAILGLEETSIQYTIYFQNTGNDTAFRVIIRDTLDPHLQLNTLTPGPSSHPYEISAYGERSLQFRFDNILLPDSNKNVEGSIGFVSFRIRRAANLPEGTEIRNRAGIYFDYNPPIITNTVVHRIGELPDGVGIFGSIKTTEQKIRVYPNPAAGTFNLSLDLDRPSPVIVRVYDQWGNLLHEDRIAQVQYLRKAISLETGRSGMAFIQVITEEEQISRKVFLTR